MGGSLAMIGTWSKALGLPMLHLSDLIIKAELTPLVPMVPPYVMIASLMLGGQICLGSEVTHNMDHLPTRWP